MPSRTIRSRFIEDVAGVTNQARCPRGDLLPTCAVRLPLDERAVEVADMRTIEPPDARRHLTQEGAIVADQQHGALVLLERVLECLDVLDVEMVRRLVEDQEIRLRQRHE